MTTRCYCRMHLPFQGKYEDADALYRRAVDISDNAPGPDNPEVTIALNNWGLMLQAQVPACSRLSIVVDISISDVVEWIRACHLITTIATAVDLQADGAAKVSSSNCRMIVLNYARNLHMAT